MLAEYEFTVQDAAGSPHTYKGSLIPARKGLPLASQLLELFSPGVIALIRSGDLAQMDPNLIIATTNGLFRTLDLDFVRKQLLANMMRDEMPVVPDDQFDSVYAGNYTELWAAVYEVVRNNRFLPFMDSLPNVSEMIALSERQMKMARSTLESATGNGPSTAASTPGSPPSPT